MSSKVTFAFDSNPLGVYQAGQLVSGTAELVTERPKTIRCKFKTCGRRRSILIDRDHDVMGLYLNPHSNSDSHTILIHFRCVVASSLILLVYCVLLSDAFVIVTGRSVGRYVCIYGKLYYIYNTHVAAWLASDT